MSAQSYLDTIENKTGKTPRALVTLANQHGLTDQTKAGEIVAWFKAEFSLGHGHAMTMAQIVRNPHTVDIKNAETSPAPPGSIGRLWLDGITTRPW